MSRFETQRWQVRLLCLKAHQRPRKEPWGNPERLESDGPAVVTRSPSSEEHLAPGSAHDAAAAGLIACVPSRPQAKTIAHNHLHEETVGRWRQAKTHPDVAFPLRPEIEIEYGKELLLLLA